MALSLSHSKPSSRTSITISALPKGKGKVRSLLPIAKGCQQYNQTKLAQATMKSIRELKSIKLAKE